MAGKKDNAIVAVVTELTTEQAAQIMKDIIKAKNKYAPKGRGTIATGKREEVGALIQRGSQRQKTPQLGKRQEVT